LHDLLLRPALRTVNLDHDYDHNHNHYDDHYDDEFEFVE